MPNLPYKTAGWDTHREVKLREIDYPLFEQEPTHFTVRRTYEGPSSTYAALALDSVDSTFNGVAASVTGTASTDKLNFGLGDHGLSTGDLVTLAITTGLSGLSAGTYYAIRVDSSFIKLATSMANARAGTAVDITTDGTGTITPPTAYFVKQGPLVDIEAGCVRYDRLFATVPAQWSEPESFAFEFPAYLAGTPGTSYNVTGITVGSGTLLLSTSATGISVGDGIQAQVKYTRGAIVYQQTIVAKATAVSSGVSVTVAGSLLGSAGAPTSVTGTVAKTSVGRSAAEPLTVGGRVVYDYALATVATLATALPIIQLFRPVDNAGNSAASLTATTIPTSSAYAALVLDGTEIVGESSSWRRYMGNIFCRATRLIPAS